MRYTQLLSSQCSRQAILLSSFFPVSASGHQLAQSGRFWPVAVFFSAVFFSVVFFSVVFFSVVFFSVVFFSAVFSSVSFFNHNALCQSMT
jgi:hypothetical protein